MVEGGLAKTSLSARDWFRIAVSRGGQWQAAGRRFFPKKKVSKEHSLRLRSWKKGSPIPIPPPKRVPRFDAMPPISPGPTFCPVCKEDLVRLLLEVLTTILSTLFATIGW